MKPLELRFYVVPLLAERCTLLAIYFMRPSSGASGLPLFADIRKILFESAYQILAFTWQCEKVPSSRFPCQPKRSVLLQRHKPPCM